MPSTPPTDYYLVAVIVALGGLAVTVSTALVKLVREWRRIPPGERRRLVKAHTDCERRLGAVEEENRLLREENRWLRADFAVQLAGHAAKVAELETAHVTRIKQLEDTVTDLSRELARRAPRTRQAPR